MRLAGNVALITGAASGIGLATCRLFGEQGATVIATDVDEFPGSPEQVPPVEFHRLDVSLDADWRRVCQSIWSTHQRLDVLVNNAGMTGSRTLRRPQDPEHFDPDEWRKVHATNLDGVALGCKYAIRLMKRRKRGSIINISSRYASIGHGALPAYAASKAAVTNLTKSVAIYCARRGYQIRCNSVHPGPIETPLWDAALRGSQDRTDTFATLGREIPLGRMGTPRDVANAVLYLACDESAFVTGAELVVDGGLLAQGASIAEF